MKYILIALGLIVSSSVYCKAIDTPQSVIKKAGYQLLLKENGKEIYIRPKDIKVSDGLILYSVTEFYTKSVNGISKYSLKADYKALSCEEKKSVLVKTQVVPYFGNSYIKDYTKSKQMKVKDFNSIDKAIANKVCNSKVI